MSPATEHTAYRVKDGQLSRVTEPIPTVKPDEVLVKVKAVSLNFRDYLIGTGKYPGSTIPNVVPGSDMSGEVVSVGESVVGINPGDAVISNFRQRYVWDIEHKVEYILGSAVDGTLREYVTLPYEAVHKINISKQGGISWEVAAALVCTGVASWNALFGLRQLKPGDVVLALGTGGISATGLSIAKAAGAVTIVTTSSDEKGAKLQKGSGVDHVINYNSTPDWEKEVLKITNGKGVDFVLENGGKGTIEKSIDSVAPGGIVGMIGFVAKPPAENPDILMKALFKGAVLRGITVGTKQHALDLIKFVENRGLQMQIDSVYKFSEDKQVREAVELIGKGKQVGKVCISF